MSEEQLKEAIQYNLDYLEGNIDFELEYKELAESYSKLYEELEAKSKMLVNRDEELITFSDEIERLTELCNKYEEEHKTVFEEWKKTINIINELKEWFKGYHKSYASCKWYEEDYIEFIEHLENELKGDDKE